jgi:hypothetical protein
LDQVRIHFSFCITENAKLDEFGGQPFCILTGVRRFNAHQHHEAMVDGPVLFSSDPDLGLADPLDDCAHGAK